MKQVAKQLLTNALSMLKARGQIPNGLSAEVVVVRSKNAVHGDYASNLALVMAKDCHKTSREIAETLVAAMGSHEAIMTIEIADPGFINFFMHKKEWAPLIQAIVSQKEEALVNRVVKSEPKAIENIQYAHARICLLLLQLRQQGWQHDYAQGLAHIATLSKPEECALFYLLERYLDVVVSTTEYSRPVYLSNYLPQLANAVHSYYNAMSLLSEPLEQCDARVCLLMAVAQVLKNGLHVLGRSAPESM